MVNVERHKRTLDLVDFTAEQLEKIQNSHILVVGAGGLGAATLPLLAAQEINSLHIVDFDTVTLSNLPRQLLYTEKDLGKNKVDSAAHYISRLNPKGKIVHTTKQVNAEWLSAYDAPLDLVLDCTDNFATRILIDQFCAERAIPLVWGAVEGYIGQLSLFHGHEKISLQDIFTEIPRERALDSGIFPPLVQQVGSMMASVALRWLAFERSELDGKFLQLDARTFVTQIFDAK